MEKYIKHREQVIKSINEFEIYSDLYNAFYDDLLKNQEAIRRFTRYEQNVFIHIRNALLFSIYLTVRKLISTSQKDNSLTSLYLECIENIPPEHRQYYTHEKINNIIKTKILPNSFDIYKLLKKYTDKAIAHMDKEKFKLPNSFKLKDLELINKDIRNALDKITFHKESSSYAFLRDEYAKTAKSFFTKIVKALINTKN